MDLLARMEHIEVFRRDYESLRDERTRSGRSVIHSCDIMSLLDIEGSLALFALFHYLVKRTISNVVIVSDLETCAYACGASCAWWLLWLKCEQGILNVELCTTSLEWLRKRLEGQVMAE